MATTRAGNQDDHLEFEQVLGGLLEVIHSAPRHAIIETLERLTHMILAHAAWEERKLFSDYVKFTCEGATTQGLVKDHELIREKLDRLRSLARRGRSRALLERELFELNLFLWYHMRREQALYPNLLPTACW